MKTNNIYKTTQEIINLLIVVLAIFLTIGIGSYLSARFVPLDFDGSIHSEK